MSAVTLRKGDDYDEDEARSLVFIDDDSAWPDEISDAESVELIVEPTRYADEDARLFVADGTVLENSNVEVNIAAADTGSMATGRKYFYRLIANMANGHTVTLAAGKIRAI